MSDNPYAQYAAQPATAPASASPGTDENPYLQYAASPPAASPTDGGGWWDTIKANLGQVGRSAEQLGEGALALPDLALTPVRAGVNAIAEKLGAGPNYLTPGAQALGQITDVQPATGEQGYVDAINRGLGGLATSFGTGSVLANSASPIASTVGTALSSAPGSQVAGTVGGSLASEASKQAGQGQVAQTIWGLLGGVGGATAANAGNIASSAARSIVGDIDPAIQQVAAKAKQYGIDLTAPQISTSTPIKAVNSVTAELPFSGAGPAAAKQQGQFNSALAQTIDLPPNTTKITPDVFSKATSSASNGFNQLWAGNNLPVDGPLLSKLVGISNDARTFGGTELGKQMDNIVDRVASLANGGAGPAGSVPGRAFQDIDTKLGKAAMEPGSAGHYAGQMQDELRDAMAQSMTPTDAAKLQDLRAIWSNIKTLSPLVAKSVDGNIPPNSLMGAVTANGANKWAMANGNRGDLGDLAQIGKLLGSGYQNSGTALRTQVLTGLGAIGGGEAAHQVGALGPALAATGATLGTGRAIQSVLRSRALYNALANQAPAPAAQPWLQNALAQRGVQAAELQQQPQPPQQNALAMPSYAGAR